MRRFGDESSSVVTLIAACSLGLSSFTAAAAQPPHKPHLRPPISDQILRVALPEPQETTLPNGIRLLVIPDHRLPTVSIQVVIREAGGYFDQSGGANVAAVTAQMLREGTTSRTAQQISRELETLGVSLVIDTSAAAADVSLRVTCLSEDFARLADILRDILTSPTFPEDGLTAYKRRQESELLRLQANPNVLAEELGKRALFGTHPMARGDLDDAFRGLTRDDLVNKHRTHYVPDRVLMLVAGDISLKSATAVLAHTLGTWSKRAPALVSSISPAPEGPSTITLLDRPGAVQTNFFLAAKTVNRHSADLEPLELMNRILGGNPTSRLFRILREEKGYVYSVASTHSLADFDGYWRVTMATGTKNTAAALAELLSQIQRMSDELVTREELRAAQNAAVARLALSLESPESVLSAASIQRRFGLPADYWNRYPARIAAVTPESIRAVARKYLRRDRLQIVAVGDGGQIRPLLATFGDVKEATTAPRGRVSQSN